MENTKKGPGRPPHNAHPTTCSGDPISEEELAKKRLEAEEKKRRKQNERQRRQDAKKTNPICSDNPQNCKISTSDCNSSLSSSSPSPSPSPSISPITNKCSYSIERILYQSISNGSLKRKSNQSSTSSANKYNRTTTDDGKVPQL
jgi:hypothetical protein